MLKPRPSHCRLMNVLSTLHEEVTMFISRQLAFECVCGVKTVSFDALFRAENGDVTVTWRCPRCHSQCVGAVTPRDLFTEEDKKFLHSCNAHI